MLKMVDLDTYQGEQDSCDPTGHLHNSGIYAFKQKNKDIYQIIDTL